MPIFVGGDTQSFYYDMQFKVANSVAENPNKIYHQDVDLSALPNPSTGWIEITNQADIDKVKSQDNTILTYSTTTAGKAKAIMMAIDLTAVCNTLYGSSNSALIAALKAIQVDVWASGSGANSGVTANGVSVYVWDTSSTAWVTNNYVNTQSTIQQISAPLSSISTKVDSSNKIYILIVSQYPSDGTIASTVNLDYIRVRVDLSRSVDVINPIPIYVPNIWAILIRGFSPSWNNTTSKDGRRIFKLSNGSYYIEFYYDATNDRFVLNRKNTDGTYSTLYSNSNEVFTNWQIINFLIEQTSTGLRFRMLKNAGTIEIYTLGDSKPLNGNMYLYLLSSDTQGYEADAFVDNFVFIPNQNYDDNAVAEDILRGNITGLASGFDFAELVQSNDFSDATKWTLSGSASIANKTLTLPDVQDTAQQDINVLPNNKYHIDLKTQTNQGIAEVKEYYNNLYIRSTLLGAGLNDFTTTPNTNKIRVLLKNQLQGFTRNSPAFLSDGTQVAANTPRLEQGQFGKAIMIEEGTTNGLAYAFSSDANLLQFFADTRSGNTVTIDTTQTPPLSGQKVVKHYAAVNDSYIEAKDANGVSYVTASTAKLAVTGGSYVTFSIWAKGQNGGEQIEILIFDYASDTGSFRVRKSQTFTITNTWQMYVVTVQTASDAVRAWARVDNNLAGQTVYWCAPQLENKAYATSFTPSIRSPETLTIPTAGVLNPQEGTVEFWWNPLMPASGIISQQTSPKLCQIGSYNSNGSITLWAFTKSGAEPSLMLYVKGQSATGWSLNTTVKASGSGWYRPNEFHYFAISWTNGNNFRVYMDGVLIGGPYTIADPISSFAGGIAYFPGDGTGGTDIKGTTNSLIDVLRISNKARTDAEIAAAYASGQPLPVDSNTTLKMDFDNLGNAIFNSVSLKLKM